MYGWVGNVKEPEESKEDETTVSLAYLGDTEVAQKYGSIRVQENILGLKVAVHHPDRVQEFLPSKWV